MKCLSLGKLLVIVGIALYFGSSPNVAQAQNNWYTKKCPTCTTGANFKADAQNRAYLDLAPGTYLVVNDTNRAAFVKVTGNVVNVCPPTEPCYPELRNITTNIVDSQGATVAPGAGEGASLEFIDQQLFGTNRSDPLPQIQAPGGSTLVNNAGWQEDADVLIRDWIADQGIQTNDSRIKRGTVVTVKYPDGSTAQFKRETVIGTGQWVYVEGSARNAAGKPINPWNGSIVSAPTSGTGSGGDISGTSSNGQSSFGMVAEAGYCVQRTTFHLNGALYGAHTAIVRCN